MLLALSPVLIDRIVAIGIPAGNPAQYTYLVFVLGFFGFPTLGYYIAASFENLHYGEVWTYLYTLIALVLVVDVWSGGLRRRLVV